MKIRMLKTYKELVEGPDWTTFYAGKVYDVPDRVANNLLGVKACVRESEYIAAERESQRTAALEEDARWLEEEARNLEAEAEAKEAKEAEEADKDEGPEEGTEERMDAGPPENKAEAPPEDKAAEDMPVHLVRGKGRGKASGKKADK